MGGKRTSGRSTSGRQMQPRISSAGSTKSSRLGSPGSPSATKEAMINSEETRDFHKSSFDIISLLESHEEQPSSTTLPRNGDRDHHFYSHHQQRKSERINDTHGLPSFWHLVQPPEPNHHLHHPIFYNSQSHLKESASQQYNKSTGKRNTSAVIMQYPGGNKLGGNPSKRLMKRRKMKKVQSAKVAGFKELERSPERLRREGVEWIRVLTPPGTDTSSICGPDNDDDDEEEEDEDEEDDELIKRYFSGLSSSGSSISWAEDAMESEFTSQLMKLWDDIEAVCRGGDRPEKMSNAVYDECLQWKRAFPDPDLHRFSSFRNEDADVVLSPVQSPIFDEGRGGGGDGDAQFSSLVHHSSRYEGGGGRKGYLEDSVNMLQSSFRSLNCATPRPNIEKSTEYVNAWLYDCQNSSVPESGGGGSGDHHHHHRPDYNSRPSTPSSELPLLRNASNGFIEDVDKRNKSRYSLRLMSDMARTTGASYSRTHAKLVAQPNPENFYTSLAITSNENSYGSYSSSQQLESLGSGVMRGDPQGNNGGSFGYNNYQSRINESDEDDDDSRASPSSLTEIVSFRPNVRVQRPISSRVRDHTMTPIATGSYAHTSAAAAYSGSRQYGGGNLNRQSTSTVNKPSSRSNSLPNQHGGCENYRAAGRMGMFVDNNTNATINVPTSATPELRGGRIQSGVAVGRNGVDIPYYGRSRQWQQQQAPWSRHTGDELAAETSYVSGLYENYQSGGAGAGGGLGSSTETLNVGSRNSLRSTTELSKSPGGSAKDALVRCRSSVIMAATADGRNGIPECEDQSLKPAVSWLMNRVSPH